MRMFIANGPESVFVERLEGGEAGYPDDSSSQWYAACSSGGEFAYPYGNSYSGVACNGSEANQAGTVPVGSMEECQSSVLEYSGVFDMSGNVMEWEDSCTGKNGADLCNLRGGGWGATNSTLLCNWKDQYGRSDNQSYFGFRCCSSP